MSEFDDDLVDCEICDARCAAEEATLTEDGCHLCPKCQAEWQAMFDACQHDWKRGFNEFGDDARICNRCSGIVRAEDFPALFGSEAP